MSNFNEEGVHKAEAPGPVPTIDIGESICLPDRFLRKGNVDENTLNVADADVDDPEESNPVMAERYGKVIPRSYYRWLENIYGFGELYHGAALIVPGCLCCVVYFFF